jgi:hypothetical protein
VGFVSFFQIGVDHLIILSNKLSCLLPMKKEDLGMLVLIVSIFSH